MAGNPVDAFDADVLIYAAVGGSPGRRVAALFSDVPTAEGAQPVGVGSLLLLPELLGKPMRDGRSDEVLRLGVLLSQLDLRPVDRATAQLASGLAASHRLRAADAVHLATAIGAGAERFITNNRKDFRDTVPGIEIIYPEDLPDSPTP